MISKKFDSESAAVLFFYQYTAAAQIKYRNWKI